MTLCELMKYSSKFEKKFSSKPVPSIQTKLYTIFFFSNNTGSEGNYEIALSLNIHTVNW
jgi:hypothetical protein